MGSAAPLQDWVSHSTSWDFSTDVAMGSWGERGGSVDGGGVGGGEGVWSVEGARGGGGEGSVDGGREGVWMEEEEGNHAHISHESAKTRLVPIP